MNRFDELNRMVENAVELGTAKEFEAVWPDVERWGQAILTSEIEFKNETLPLQIEQVKKKVEFVEKRRESLLSDLEKTKQAIVDGWNRFYHWATFIFWVLVLIGETLAFPYIYRDVFDMPLLVGFGFCALFPAASLFVKGIFYGDLSEQGKRLFRKVLSAIWAIKYADIRPLFPDCPWHRSGQPASDERSIALGIITG